MITGSTITTHHVGLSVTEDLHFSAFLDASRELTFVGCVPAASANGKVLFRFRDPQQRLLGLYEKYAAGAAVPAIDLSQSLRMLRREMTNTLTTSNTGKQAYGTRNSTP